MAVGLAVLLFADSLKSRKEWKVVAYIGLISNSLRFGKECKVNVQDSLPLEVIDF